MSAKSVITVLARRCGNTVITNSKGKLYYLDEDISWYSKNKWYWWVLERACPVSHTPKYKLLNIMAYS